jgi:hypothetical protein
MYRQPQARQKIDRAAKKMGWKWQEKAEAQIKNERKPQTEYYTISLPSGIPAKRALSLNSSVL